MKKEEFKELAWSERKEIIAKAKKELVGSISFSELFDKIREITGINDLDFNVNVKDDCISIVSNDIIDKIGIMALSIKSVRLETFNSSIVFDENKLVAYWWGSIEFRYELADGGNNGMRILYFEYRNGKYEFRLVKKGI